MCQGARLRAPMSISYVSSSLATAIGPIRAVQQAAPLRFKGKLVLLTIVTLAFTFGFCLGYLHGKSECAAAEEALSRALLLPTRVPPRLTAT